MSTLQKCRPPFIGGEWNLRGKKVVILLLIVTTLLWGATPILEKVGLARVDPLIGVTVRSAIVTAGLLILIFLMGKGRELIELDGKSILIFGASGVMAGLLGMWTYYAALKMEATSKIVPIAACYPLVTALLSVLILKEGITLPRVIGTAMIVSGVWLVK
jgi:transporter family protein